MTLLMESLSVNNLGPFWFIISDAWKKLLLHNFIKEEGKLNHGLRYKTLPTCGEFWINIQSLQISML